MAAIGVDFLVTADWLVVSLVLLPIVFLVVFTHRERARWWWDALERPLTPPAGFVIWFTWLLLVASSGLARVLAVRHLKDEVASGALIRFVVVGEPLVAALVVAWVLVVYVAHGKGYAILLSALAALLAVAVQVALLVLWWVGALVYAPFCVWAIYLLVASAIVWSSNRVGPTPVRPRTFDDDALHRPDATLESAPPVAVYVAAPVHVHTPHVQPAPLDAAGARQRVAPPLPVATPRPAGFVPILRGGGGGISKNR